MTRQQRRAQERAARKAATRAVQIAPKPESNLDDTAVALHVEGKSTFNVDPKPEFNLDFKPEFALDSRLKLRVKSQPATEPAAPTHTPGQGSTGPRTPFGKEISSRNALNHGLRATKHFILEDESIDEYNGILAMYMRELNPVTEMENDMVNRIAEARWRLMRCEQTADRTFDEMMMRNPNPRTWTLEDHKVITNFKKYATMAERTFRLAMKDLVEFRKKNPLQSPAPEPRPAKLPPNPMNLSIEEQLARKEFILQTILTFRKSESDDAEVVAELESEITALRNALSSPSLG